MNVRALGALALAAGLVAAAAVVSEAWATFALSGGAGLCLGLAGWSVWRGRRNHG